MTGRRVTVGQIIHLLMPASEVCMHLHVVDQVRPVQVLNQAAQILNPDGTPFSIPVTHGEAGLYRDANGLYASELPTGLVQVYRDGKPISPPMPNELACLGWMHRHVGSSSAHHALTHEGYGIDPAAPFPTDAVDPAAKVATWHGHHVDQRVELVKTADTTTELVPGTLGTVTGWDERGGVLHIRWDDGSTLSMLVDPTAPDAHADRTQVDYVRAVEHAAS